MSKPKAIKCPNCSAPLKLQGGGRVLTITCQYCKSVIDLTQNYKVLYNFKSANPPESSLKIGMEGEIFGVCWRIIGWIVYKDLDKERWSEFLLFNPYYGYGWLVEESEKYYFSRRVRDLDLRSWARNPHPPRVINYKNRRFFQDDEPYQVLVDYVEGELTWIAKRGDRLYSWDYHFRAGEYLNIERSEIEVESYYTKPIKKSLVEKFEYPEDADKFCKKSLNKLPSTPKNSLKDELEESEDVEKDNDDEVVSSKILLIFMIIFLIDIITLFRVENMERVVVKRDVITNKKNHLVDKFRVEESNSFTEIKVYRYNGVGFNVDINLTKLGSTEPIFMVKDGLITYPKNPNAVVSRVGKDATGVEAKLILDEAIYYITVDKKEPNMDLAFSVKVGASSRGTLFLAFIIFFIFHWWILHKYKYEQKKIPKWFMWGGVVGAILVAFIAFSIVVAGVIFAIASFTFLKYVTEGEESND
jgi:hypothetical protein